MAHVAKLGSKARVFARTTSREDGRYAGIQAGFVTTNDDDEYKVSYIELGGRLDHVVDPIVNVSLTRRACPDLVSTVPTLDSPLEYDADLFTEDASKEAVSA